MRSLATGFLIVASASAFAIVQASWTPVEAQPASVEAGQTPQQQTNPVSRIAAAPKTSRSVAIGRPKKVRTAIRGPLQPTRTTRPSAAIGERILTKRITSYRGRRGEV